ncbi:uncharacterized protein PHACADRAFT_256818, partial [Phanerochaete carnosa HHB-10118-sp]
MPQGKESPHIYSEWAKKYNSDILHLEVLGTHIVVLNSAKVATELLDKRSKVYSGRVQSVMMFELTGFDRDWGLFDYGDKWKKHLQVHYRHFGPKALQEYHPRMMKGVRTLLRLLHESPEAYVPHLRLMTGSTIISIVYGKEVQSADDQYIKLAEDTIKIFSTIGTPGSFLVDSIPVLKYLPSWFPGAGFKRQAEQWKKTVDAAYELPFNEVKAALRRGDSSPSITRSLLEGLKEGEDTREMEDVIMNVSGMAYPTASDTMIITLTSFILAMLLYPDVQRTVQV